MLYSERMCCKSPMDKSLVVVFVTSLVSQFKVIYTSNGTCDREINLKEVQFDHVTGI